MALLKYHRLAAIFSLCLCLSGCFTTAALLVPGSYKEDVPLTEVSEATLLQAEQGLYPSSRIFLRVRFCSFNTCSLYGFPIEINSPLGATEASWGEVYSGYPGADFSPVSGQSLPINSCLSSQCKKDKLFNLCVSESKPSLKGELRLCGKENLMENPLSVTFPNSFLIERRHWWGYPISGFLLPFSLVADIISSPVEIYIFSGAWGGPCRYGC